MNFKNTQVEGLHTLNSRTSRFMQSLSERLKMKIDLQVGKALILALVMVVLSSVSGQVYAQATDNDEPLPTVTLSTTTPNVIEGETAIITFTSNRNAPANGLSVDYVVIHSGSRNFFTTNGLENGSVTISEGETTSTINFVSLDDNVDEPDGSFWIYLTNEVGYTFGTVRSVRVNIADNDSEPVLSVSTLSDLIQGNEEYYYRITASNASSTDLVVNYQFLKGAAHNLIGVYRNHRRFTLPAGATVYEYFDHSSASNQAVAPLILDGYSEFIIKGGRGYQVAPSPNDRKSIVARRFEVPAGISIVSGGVNKESYSRGALFQVTASTVATTDRTINVNVSDGTSDFLNTSEQGTREVVILGGKTTANFGVPMINDQQSEPDGYITATILPGVGYTVANTHNVAKFKVLDDDGTPLVFVSPILDRAIKLVEGIPFEVRVFATGPVNQVRIRVRDDGGNLYTGPETLLEEINQTGHLFVSINTQHDTIIEEDGTLTVEVLPGTGYEIASDYRSASFTIYDDDGVNEIQIEAVESTITEGQFALFRLTPTYHIRRGFVVNFSYDQGESDFIGELMYQDYRKINHSKLLFSKTGTTGTIGFYNYYPFYYPSKLIRIPTIDDDNQELHGNLTMTITAPDVSGHYTLNSDATKNSATIQILDNDGTPAPPEVSLSTLTSSVVEGITVTMTLTSTIVAPSNGLVVSYSKGQVGNFFTTSFSGSDSVTILSGETTKNIEFATHDDNVDEANGSFTISLVASSGYTLGSDSSETVQVTDNDDPPVLTIADAPAVVEGTDDYAVFTITASNPVEEARTINVEISGWVHFIPSGQTPSTTTLEANSSTATLRIPIEDDEVDEDNGVISVTIVTPTNPDDYQLSSSRIAGVSVTDNDDPLPVVSLSTNTRSVTEGATVTITLTSDQTAPTDGLMLSYEKSQTGNFFAASFSGSGSENILTGGTSVNINFETQDDDIDEEDGSFTITLTSSTAYTLGTTSSITVNVADNDSAPADAPVISVSSNTDQIGPGENFYYRIKASHASEVDLYIALESYTNYYSPFAGTGGGNPRKIRLVAGTTVYDITTGLGPAYSFYNKPQFDGYDELTIKEGVGYHVAPTPNDTARIDARRYNEPTGISIVSSETIAESYRRVAFQITASNIIQTPRTVKIDVSDDESDFLINQGTTSLVLPAGQSTAFLEVPLSDDEVDEPDGYITATILPGEGYTVASTKNFARVKVIDDDGTVPEIFLSPNIHSGHWMEGHSKSVAITSYISTINEISVRLRISDGGDNLYTGNEIVTIQHEGGSYSYHTIHTRDDTISEDNGTISVELLSGTGYEIAPDFNRASFTVYDDDGDNEISVEAVTSTVTEGQYAQFRLTPTSFRPNAYQVFYKLDQGHGDFIGELFTHPRSQYTLDSFEHAGLVTWSHVLDSVLVRVPTIDDDVDEANGQISLSLMKPRELTLPYSLSSDSSKISASVNVLDNDEPVLPEVSLSTTTSSVVEGGTAVITLTSTQAAPTDGLMVGYQKSQIR